MTITPFGYKQVTVLKLVLIKWQRLRRNSRRYTLYTHNATLWQSFTAAATLSWSRESGDSTSGALVSSFSFSQLFIFSHASSWFPLLEEKTSTCSSSSCEKHGEHKILQRRSYINPSVNTEDIVEINEHQSVELFFPDAHDVQLGWVYTLYHLNLTTSSRRPICEMSSPVLRPHLQTSTSFVWVR